MFRAFRLRFDQTLQRIHVGGSPLEFHTTISFPRNAAKTQDNPRYSLKTSTSNTTYELDLPSVQLVNLALESSNKPINAPSPIRTSSSVNFVTSNATISAHRLTSPVISATTSNASVKGSYITGRLKVQTSNHPLRLDGVTLSDPNENEVSLSTSNAPVTAKISLRPSLTLASSSSRARPLNSPLDPDAPPSYDQASAQLEIPAFNLDSDDSGLQTSTLKSRITTSNAPIEIEYDLTLPGHVRLESKVTTSNAPVKLVHRGFSGVFEATTSNAKTIVSGERDKRTEGGSTKGRIGDGGEGRSVATTSNAKVDLRFE